MARIGLVYNNGIFAGRLYRDGKDYCFRYDSSYLDSTHPQIAFTFPKSTQEYRSSFCFPFFYGILAEGELKSLQCSILRIDENDHFTRLLKTVGNGSIGSITIRESHE